MRVIFGDIISLAKNGEFDLIVHGCNCFCTMGAGVAKCIKEEFPEAYEADLETIKGERAKIGTYTIATINRPQYSFRIINAYTQYDWRGKGIKVDYDSLRLIFRKIKAEFSGIRIGYPLIGAGLARGDWSTISKIIDKELADEDHCLVRLPIDSAS